MSRRGWALFAAMSVIWGLPYLLIRVAVGELPPAAVVLCRVGLGTLLLLPVCVARGLGRTVWPALRRWRPLLAYTVIEIAVPWLLLTHAEERLTSSLTGILVAATVFVVAVLGWATGTADRPDRRRTLGLLVGFSGVVVLLGLDVGSLSWLPVAEVGVVTVCYAVGPMVLTRHLADLPGLGVVTASTAITTLVYLPVVLLGPAVPWGDVTTRGVWSLLGLAAICTAAAFVVFFALIAEVGPARAVLITYVNPAVALLLGVVGLGEPLTLGLAIGFPLVLGGCLLGASRSRARPDPPSPVAPAVTAGRPVLEGSGP